MIKESSSRRLSKENRLRPVEKTPIPNTSPSIRKADLKFAERELRLESKTKLTPSALLAYLVQKPRNGFLLTKTGVVEVLAHGLSELLFVDSVLANELVQHFSLVDFARAVLEPLVGGMGFAADAIGGEESCLRRGRRCGVPVHFLGLAEVGTSDGDRGRGTKADSIRKEQVGVIVGKGAGGVQFVGVAV